MSVPEFKINGLASCEVGGQFHQAPVAAANERKAAFQGRLGLKKIKRHAMGVEILAKKRDASRNGRRKSGASLAQSLAANVETAS